MTTRHAWRLAPWALVKTTGFAYDTLESLRIPDLAERVDSDAVADAVTDCLTKLVEACSDERFLEAVMLSSKTAYAQLSKWLSNVDVAALRSPDKRKALVAATYLQRFCAKNESTSFFGPVYWASVGGDSVRLDTGDPAEPQLIVRWTHWAAQALADTMFSDPLISAEIPARRPIAVTELDGGQVSVTYQQWPFEIAEITPPSDEFVRWVWQRCDDASTPIQLANERGVSVEAVLAALTELTDAGLVDHALRVPSGVIDPLAALRELVERISYAAAKKWRQTLTELTGATERLHVAANLMARADAFAALGAAFTATTGSPADKDAGRYYTDRSIIVEDGHFPWHRLDIGEPVLGYLNDELPPVMDLLFELPLASRRRRVALITDWYRAEFGDNAMPLPRVLMAARDADLAATLRRAHTETVATGPSAVTDLLLANTDRASVNLDQSWAVEHAAAVDFDTWCVAGADMFLAAPDVAAINANEFQVVVGELHGLHDQLLQGLWPALHPSPQRLADDVAELIDGLTDGRICDPVLQHWRKTHARIEALPEVEFTARSPRPDAQRDRAADLIVEVDNGRLVLHGPTLGRIYLTRPPLAEWDDEVDTIFAPFTGARVVCADDMMRDTDHVDHLPRLTVGRTVVHRETWRLPAPAPSNWRGLSVDNQLTVRALRSKFDLPQRVYAKFPGELKPLFIDFDVPVLVDLFSRYYARATRSVTVSEMLPDADQLWLADHRGRHTSELRFGFYRPQSGMLR